MNGFDAIKWLARVGFLVKGVLYMIIGALALHVAAKAGGGVTGTRGARSTVLGQPFGRTLLLAVVGGLLATPPGASFNDSSIQTAWATIGAALRSVRASWRAQGGCEVKARKRPAPVLAFRNPSPEPEPLPIPGPERSLADKLQWLYLNRPVVIRQFESLADMYLLKYECDEGLEPRRLLDRCGYCGRPMAGDKR
jgi:hypothetical protein